jgi:hypothetical protein
MALSYDWIALNSKIDAMSPDGATNQAIGLQRGFQSLTSTPFTIPPMDPNYTCQQVIISPATRAGFRLAGRCAALPRLKQRHPWNQGAPYFVPDRGVSGPRAAP